ncbi:MAG: hypothetical protein GY765_02420 [bacterium]|nr:hypothetical protein [bacterium]
MSSFLPCEVHQSDTETKPETLAVPDKKKQAAGVKAATDTTTGGDDQTTGGTTRTKRPRAYADVMDMYHTVIHNAVKPKYQGYLTVFGYTGPRIGEAGVMKEEVEILHKLQNKTRVAQLTNTKAFEPLLEEVEDALACTMHLVHAAVYKDTPNRIDLGLNKRRESKFTKKLEQWKLFYGNLLLNTEVLERLLAMGLTAEKLEAERQNVLNLSDLNAEKKDLKADAQTATEMKHEAMKELNTWMGDFLTVCRRAFRPNPQMLEAMGITKK